jgi:hypothetical protein
MGELYLRSFLDITNADYENAFIFPSNVKVQLTGFGVVASTLVGNGIDVRIRRRSNIFNNTNLRAAASGNEIKISGTLTGPGWLAYRVAPEEGGWFMPELVTFGHSDTDDGQRHGYCKVRINKDTISSFRGYCWVTARIWSIQDARGGGIGIGSSPTAVLP